MNYLGNKALTTEDVKLWPAKRKSMKESGCTFMFCLFIIIKRLAFNNPQGLLRNYYGKIIPHGYIETGFLFESNSIKLRNS